MDYDTWKTTDFEGEAQAEEEEAIEKAQIELAEALFDAYLSDNEKVVQEVHEVLRSDRYWRWQSTISGACTYIAGKEETLSKIDEACGSYEL
jgi:hypothetical protein